MPEAFGPETSELQNHVNEVIEDEIRELRQEQASERDKEKKDSKWFNLIGLSTGIISTLAAIAAMKGGYLANEATLDQMKSNDQWGLYQAKSTKRHIEENTATLLNAFQKPVPIKTTTEIKKLRQEQSETKKEAEHLQEESQESLRRHELFALSVAALQVSISLSAIAALLRKKPVWFFGLGIGIIGIIFMIQGFLPESKSPTHSKISEISLPTQR